jgi:hypothetical protein
MLLHQQHLQLVQVQTQQLRLHLLLQPLSLLLLHKGVHQSSPRRHQRQHQQSRQTQHLPLNQALQLVRRSQKQAR